MFSKIQSVKRIKIFSQLEGCHEALGSDPVDADLCIAKQYIFKIKRWPVKFCIIDEFHHLHPTVKLQ